MAGGAVRSICHFSEPNTSICFYLYSKGGRHVFYTRNFHRPNKYRYVAEDHVRNAMLFGVGVVTTLSIPALAEHAKYLIPAVVVASFALTPFLVGFCARRMRIRNWGVEGWQKGDLISG